MKKYILLAVLVLGTSVSSYAQYEEGDIEVVGSGSSRQAACADANNEAAKKSYLMLKNGNSSCEQCVERFNNEWTGSKAGWDCKVITRKAQREERKIVFPSR